MKLPFAILSTIFAAMLLAVAPANPIERATTDLETRCGWFSNPTPGNIWLYDREAEWTIGVQGGYQVEGDWDWPSFKDGQWTETNGRYGYGCACMRLRVNRRTREVLEIKSVRARPLAACRRDPSLKKWKRYLGP